MSDEKVVPFPSPPKYWIPTRIVLPRWRCSIHGEHDQVFHIATRQGESRHYCLMCMVDLLDRLGFKTLPQVE